MSCSARNCSRRCASTGAGFGASPPTGCFPATDGIPQVIRSPPRSSGLPVRTPHNALGLNINTFIPTPCATALPRICSKPVPTCAPSDAARASRPGGDDDLSASLPETSQRHRQSAGCTHDPRTRRADTERMNRPPLEVADIVRCAGQLFVERSRRWITWQHQKILLAIARCRTAALGGHRDHCSDCGYSAISYNSCRNRHCPKCQGNARLHWLQARERELLPVSYVHVVFTLPRELAPLALQNKRLIYNLLFTPVLQLCWRSPAIHATWSRDRLLQRAPYLEPAIATSSSCPLRAGCRRSRSGSLPLDLLAPLLLSSRQGAQPCLPRQVCRRTQDRLSAGALQFHGHL